jgi:hypothetical protein
MKPATARLLLAAVLFVSWLGYLAYLVLSATWPTVARRPPIIVLSRPQFLVSTLDVIAEVGVRSDGRPDPVVSDVEVHWPPDTPAPKGGSLRITNLPEITASEGWQGAGRYILPLVRDGEAYRLVPIPPSPGYDPEGRVNRSRIYPATPQALEQLRQIPKPAS